MSQSFITKLKPFLPYAALLLLPAALFLLLTNRGAAPYQEVHSENGVWDLRGFDFENYNALLVGELSYIPNALLTPEEFATQSGDAAIGHIGSVIHEDFLTSRDIILMPNDGWFTFTRRSATYSQRQYVNGVWLSDTGRGRPGYSRETDIADTGTILFTTRPQDGIVELVQQSSNFVHRQGNRHWGWQVSYSTGLIYESRASDYRQGIIMGGYLLLFLLFMLLFFMMQRNRAALYFALFCLLWFARSGMGETRAFTVLFPWLDWSVKFRIEYLLPPMAAVLTLGIIDVLFPNALNKTVIRIYGVIAAVLIAVNMFADTVLMSHIGLASYVIFGLGVVYVLACFIIKVRNTNMEQKIFIGGMLLFLFAVISDIVLFTFYNYGFNIMPFEFSIMAVLVFALCMAAAVFIAILKETEEAKENEKRLADENAAHDTLSRMKTDFLANISHEIKTPLTVVSNYARLTERQLKAGTADEKTTERQNIIFQETQRLSKLVDKLLDISVTKGGFEGFCPIAGITRQTAQLLRPILAKNGNHLDIHIENDCPPVAANSDSILQVLLNLAGNANRHVKNGKISITVKQEVSTALFRIEDNGTGISEELLGSVFERGVSGDGGTGLGLSIAKELIESYGGSIGIESGKESRGTVVWFTLPLFNVENPEENR